MSRGGRGGGAVGGVRVGGKELPFEVDAALEDQIAKFAYDDDDDWTKTLYPPVSAALTSPRSLALMTPTEPR